METFLYLIKNFFTHKDFLPPADELSGTLFTPLHFAVSGVLLSAVIVFAIILSKRDKRTVTRTLTVIWVIMLILEPIKILWESLCGAQISFEVGGILPLYPCSVFLYAYPFTLAKNEKVRLAAYGYICTVGLLGAAINFFYPVNVLSNYSSISFAGCHTLFYHGAMLFACLALQISGIHRYTHIKRAGELILPALPMLIMSIPANIINFSPIGSDYMFFKANSFFLPAIFGDTPDIVTLIIGYAIYTVVPALFYLPGYLLSKKKS